MRAAPTLTAAFPASIEALARDVLKRADAAQLSLRTLESCTGGLPAGLLTDVVGLAHVFEREFMTYRKKGGVRHAGPR